MKLFNNQAGVGPPNPKEFERNISIFFGKVFVTIFSLAENSSGSSKLILGAINEFCIIKIE